MLRIPAGKSEFHRVTARGKPPTVGKILAHPAVNIRHLRSGMVSKLPRQRLKFSSLLPDEEKDPLKF